MMPGMFAGKPAGGGSVAHAYWRISVSANNGDAYTGIAELQFRATVGGASLCTGGTPLASSSFGSNPISLAFDADQNTSWFTNTGMGVPSWAGYHLAAASLVEQVALQASAFGGSALTRMPKDFVVQSSDDGVSWGDEWAVTNQTAWGAAETRTFNRP